MSDFLQIFYVSNARRFGFSKNVKLIQRLAVVCLFFFNQSELTSLVVTQCQVSEKMNMKSETIFLLWFAAVKLF